MSYVELNEVKFNDFTKVDYVVNSAKTIISDGTETKAVTYGDLGYESSGISVTVSCDNATSISISDGTTTRTKSGSSASFEVQYGTYTVSATNGTNTVSEQIVVDTAMDYTVALSFVHIYGIRRDQNSSSPEWTRTDEAVGKTAVASVGNVTIGHSDFDNCYPWSEMKRYVMSTNDVMVYIPEFWYKRVVDEDGIETIQIASMITTGFEKHPGSGRYISAYFSVGSENKSISGQQNYQSFSLNSGRTTAAVKGAGWQVIDAAVWSAIQMLILVEFANNDVQTAIGIGDRNQAQNNSTRFNYWSTGACDNLTYPTGAGENGYTVTYRGIEGLWGLAWIPLDGVLINGGNSIYVTTDQSKFGSSNISDYTLSSYTTPVVTTWPPVFGTKNGYDPTMSWFMIPSVLNGSSTTGLCDGVYTENGATIPAFGGGSDDTNLHNGIFCIANVPATKDVRHHGLRLVYTPSLDTNNSTTITNEWTYGG